MKQKETHTKEATLVARLLGESVTDCIQVDGRWYAVEVSGTQELGIERSKAFGQGESRELLVLGLGKEISAIRSNNEWVFPVSYTCRYSVQFPVSKEERK